MKFIFFTLFAIFGSGERVSTSNILVKEQATTDIKEPGRNSVTPITSIKEGKRTSKDGVYTPKQHFFLSNNEGFAVIIDANSYERITSFLLPELGTSVTEVVDNTFYSIDTVKGEIKSIPVENLITQNFDWTYVGYFPPQNRGIANSATVNGSHIYFVAFGGDMYKYDTVSRTVFPLGNVAINIDAYISLTTVNNIIYIFIHEYLYSFDGSTVTTISTAPPYLRQHSALFEVEGSVCIVGGNTTDISPDPVQCYDPVGRSWRIHSYINDARNSLAVAKSQSGVHIFGGYSTSKNGLCDTAERFAVDENKWGYIPSPFWNLDYNKTNVYYNAVTFYL